MPTVRATVNWDSANSVATVDPDPINLPQSNGATVIQWSAGTDVTGFTITGLDSSEFTPSSSGSNVTNFSTTDQNNNNTLYSYNVSATHTSGQQSPPHDPKIQNGTT